MFSWPWYQTGRDAEQVAAAAAAAAVAAGSQWVGVLEVDASWRNPFIARKAKKLTAFKGQTLDIAQVPGYVWRWC